MADPQNVELEAAKFLHKLIQESKDEPSKLATKLYVILQHMRSSGKENSMPYQVISRAMETVIKEHNLDIETLMSSRLPLASGSQIGDSSSQQLAGSSQWVGPAKESKSGNEIGTPEAYASTRTHSGPVSGGHQGSAAHMGGAAVKVHGVSLGASGSYISADSANRMQFGNSSFDGNVAAKMSKDRSAEGFPFSDQSAGKSLAGKTLDHGGSSLVTNANMSSFQGSLAEPNLTRTAGSRDTGKSPVPQASNAGLPFKEQQLKQLRAQCLVFLAFRNGLMPKKLHLEIALGNIYSKEDGTRSDLVDQKGKDQLVHDPSSVPEVQRSLERTDRSKGHQPLLGSNSPKEADFVKFPDERISQPVVPLENEPDRKCSLTRGKTDTEATREEATESRSALQREPHDSSMRGSFSCDPDDDLGNHHQRKSLSYAVMTPVEQSMLEDSGPSVNGFANIPVSTTFVTNEGVLLRPDDATSHAQNLMDCNNLGKSYPDKIFSSFPLKDKWKPVSGMGGQNNPAMPIKDSVVTVRNFYQETDQEEGYTSMSANRQPSPKHTTVDKWILDRQKRKVLADFNWAQKQQKTAQKITASSDRLKEIVSSSEDISAKTKSVIELKKLQLLELQRHLRRDILNDFFRPIANEMDRLKSIKKHRIGRRSKQTERYEQKMKEERHKRNRERQKDFFSEIEVYRERLEDGVKVKRERWKGFNRYVREFHKRKERFHREKIDRIQREKINLLKINDVEGYLRMVQDAKSDRVNKLLKETEKYLQKLGSKLKDAKALTGQFKTDIEASKGGTAEESEDVENEDEKDEAKHYLESNEKYYTMAHSVKETVSEQPKGLIGGKLREYQLNGLRWLVSLYNNHLNGILADEMGLGKTVQVISLICYLMETKNDRGPFLVVVPSSVLPGWESEINLWAPSIHKIVYCGSPDERRRLFKEQIVHQKFNVLLTTYEYLMNKHDRPKLSKIQWHYVIIDEGHRIKNASCKLNADLKLYRSNHRLLLTGTPLQNNLEELWALLNFLLPNIFNSSEDFSQWFNKPFESNGDNSPDEALLSEEENLLIINRLHQVLRPFVLRRLKHKVENQLPEKIERLIRCEASAYQKLLMKRVEDNLGAIGTSKARSVHNSVMELRNICNHPYLSQLHVEEVHDLIPKHYLPNVIRLCGKLEMLDRLLPKLKATDHRVLLFSTMTRLLDVMEDYLCWKQYKYLRLDGHTSGGDRGALIDKFNHPDSPYFIFLLSIRAGGVGVNLQAADTVIIFDTDWNPQVDLQAQARAHRIGQKKDVLVIRLETVQTVEEQVRASAEHKLGVANQSITAGFFDNNTSAEDRREYLESLLRESKKEEAAPVLDDDSLNDIIARSESEIDIFESVDEQRRSDEMVVWQNIYAVKGLDKSKQIPPLPARLITDDDLKSFYEVMKISEVRASSVLPNPGMKRKSGYLGGLDTQQYGRGKRAREVRSYEEQWTEEEFEKLCQADSPESPTVKEEGTRKTLSVTTNSTVVGVGEMQAPPAPQLLPHPIVEPLVLQNREATPPSKRGRGRPKRVVEVSSSVPSLLGPVKAEEVTKVEPADVEPGPDSLACTNTGSLTPSTKELKLLATPNSGTPISPSPTPAPDNSGPPISPPSIPVSQVAASPLTSGRGRGRGRKSQIGGEAPAPRRRGKRQTTAFQTVPVTSSLPVTEDPPVGIKELAPSSAMTTDSISVTSNTKEVDTDPNSVLPSQMLPSASVPSNADVGPQQGDTPGSVAEASVNQADPGIEPSLNAQATLPSLSGVAVAQSIIPSLPITTTQGKGRGRGRGRGQNVQSREEAPQRRRRRQDPVVSIGSGALTDQDSGVTEPQPKRTRASVGRKDTARGERGQDLPNASQYAGQESGRDKEIGTGKLQVPPREQDIFKKPDEDQGNEVLPSKSDLPDNLPSISKSDPAVSAPISLVSNSAGKSEVAFNKEEFDNKETCVDGSTVSVTLSDINCGTSEDPQSSVFNSVVVEKDQSLNSVVVEAAAATSGSVSLEDGINKFDHTCQTKDGVFDSTENPNLDELPAPDNSSKESTDEDPLNSVSELSYRSDNLKASEDTESLPVSNRNSDDTGESQLFENANIQVASAVVPSPLPGEIGNYGCLSENEADKIIDSSGSSNLNAPSVFVGLSKGGTSTAISANMKSTEDETGKVAINEHRNNIPVLLPASTANVHVDFSAITTSTMSVSVRTTIEEVCTELDSVSPAAVPPLALGSTDIGVGSEQGAITSSLMPSGDASTNPMAGSSSNKKDSAIFPIPSVQATEENIADPSAGEAPKGCGKDAGINVEKLEDPLQEKDAKENEGTDDTMKVLVSENAVSNNLAPISTMDAAVGDLNSMVFNCGNLSAGECEESDSKNKPDDKDQFGGSSLVSTLVSQSNDNHGTTVDSQCLLEKQSNSTDLEKDQNIGLVAIEDPQTLPVLDSNPAEMAKEYSTSIRVDAASALGSMSPSAGKGNSGSPSTQGMDKNIESSEDLQGATNPVSEMLEVSKNVSGRALLSENEKNLTPDGVLLSPMANVTVPAFKPTPEISVQSHTVGDQAEQESEEGLGNKDFDPKPVLTYTTGDIGELESKESYINCMDEKVELGFDSGLREAENQACKETGNLDITETGDPAKGEECTVSTSVGSSANTEKTVDESENTREDDTVKLKGENDQVEVLASKPESYDSLPSDCALEPDAALSTLVPLPGSRSAKDEHLESKESDIKVSLDDSVPDVSGRLSDHSCKDADQELNNDIPEAAVLPAESDSAGDRKEHEEMVKIDSVAEDTNTTCEENKDISGGEAEVEGGHEVECPHAEVDISTEVSGPKQEESCQLDGDDTTCEVVKSTVGNEGCDADEDAKENPPSDVPSSTIEVYHSAGEDSVASDNT